MANLSPITWFNTSSGFFFQFEACRIYCFHAEFVFDFVLDVLIVIYALGVYLSEVKFKYYLFFFGNQFLFYILLLNQVMHFILLLILLFIKAIDQDLLGGLWIELQWRGRGVRGGGGVALVGENFFHFL